MVLAHGMVDHEEHFSKNVEKSNGIYLTAGFLFKNGFVDEVFNDECEADETKLITERQVKVTVPIQKYQSTHWKVSMMRPMLRC